jgi:predicted esterase
MDDGRRDRAFHEIATDIFALHEAGRFRDALDRVEAAAPSFPDRAEAIVYWRACLHTLLGESGTAIEAFRSGIEAGLWWDPSMLPRDPDLAALRDSPELTAIVQTCEARLVDARATASPGLEVARATSRETPRTLLIALHWRGRDPAEHNAHWRSAAGSSATLAFPRSSQQTGMASFGWDDRDLAQRELADVYRRLERTEPFDPACVVAGGVSQGAALAIQLTLAGDVVPARGFIAVVPAIRTAAFDNLLPDAAARGVRGWIISGERDYGRADAESLHARLNAAGIACGLEVVPGLGHDIPDDFATRLSVAMSFVLG